MRVRRGVTIGAAIALLSVLLAPGFAHAGAEIIGSLKNVTGNAHVVRDSERLPATVGLRLHAGDLLETDAGASLGLILRDDSILSLGPSSRIAIDRFSFAPAQGVFALTARILRGTVAYLSGLIVKFAPDSATFVTPVATIGVRGTHFAVRVEE